MNSPAAHELETLVRARYPVLYVVTWEEARVEEALAWIAGRRDKKLFLWSVARGLQAVGQAPEPGKRGDQRLTDPSAALDHVLESMENGIYVFRDLHLFLGSPPVARRVRELANHLKNSFKTLVIVGPTLNLPLELQKDVTLVELPLPDREELGALLDHTLAEVNEATGRGLAIVPDTRERIIEAAAGLTLNEAENVLAKALVMHGRLGEEDVPVILSEKEQIIRKSGLLEYFRADAGMEEIGGLDVLKDWLAKRSVAFEQGAREYGLPAPKGVLLVGVQGCGKSLAARAIARFWGLPLLRLDVGRLFNSLVGSSEENLRNAVRVAESVAPAVLWVDEIEKSFAGSTGASADGGTAARVLSTFLTWLQEKTAPVFVVATANNLDELPPELLRRGRLDETFFLDLPDASERREIFRIHLERRRQPVSPFDLDALVGPTEGFSGAEIEQCVIAGMFEAYSARQPLSTSLLERCAWEMVPLSRMMKEPIDRLREWAQGRARRASSGLALPIRPYRPE